MYCIMNTYANNGIVTRHRTISGMVRAMLRGSKAFYRSHTSGSILPWEYGVVDSDWTGRALTEEERAEVLAEVSRQESAR